MMFRSRLYVPGNQPRMLINAGVYGADMVVLDLEDSVPVAEKDSARDLVAESIWSLDFGRSGLYVRINSDPDDFVLDLGVLNEKCNGVLLPKAESLEIVELLSGLLAKTEEAQEIEPGRFIIVPIIESAVGLENALAIASHERVAAMTLGVEDLTADLGMHRKDEDALLYAKSRIVVASRAGNAAPLDSVYGNFRDEEGLLAACLHSRDLGFEGRGAIHPNQLDTIHKAFAPSMKELDWASRVVEAARAAEAEGIGAVTVDGAMVDPPVVKRAERIIDAAKAPGAVLDLDPVPEEEVAE